MVKAWDGGRKGWSLIELITVTILIGLLALISIPAYRRTVENSWEAEAKNNLNILYMAEKIYYLDNKTYWFPGGAGGAITEEMIPTMNEKLNVDIPAPQYYDLSVEQAESAGKTASPGAKNDFRIKATRKGTSTGFEVMSNGKIKAFPEVSE